MAEAAAKVDLQCVVGADAFGEPGPSVGEGGVGFLCVGGNVVGTGGDWRSSERRTDREADVGTVGGGGWERRVPSWENGGARSGGTNDALRFVGVDADEFVVAV